MPLEFYLVPNHITPDPDDYMAISRSPQSYSIEDVFDHMTREGSTITKAEALAVFEEITQGIINLVTQGNTVATPLVNIRPTISGVFNGDDDKFDRARHQVRINVSPGLRLRKSGGQITSQKIAAQERQPAPVHFFDNGSETQDEIITPGRGARITGSLLKFDEADQNQGIFFANEEDSSETRVDSPMLKNKPGELIFMNPELPAGTYRLEVRSSLNRTSSDELRTGMLHAGLSVAGS